MRSPILITIKLFPEINQDDADLTSVILVDGAGGIYHTDAVFQGQAASGANLRLVTGRHGNGEPCGDQFYATRFQGNGRFDTGSKVHAGRPLGSIIGKGKPILD